MSDRRDLNSRLLGTGRSRALLVQVSLALLVSLAGCVSGSGSGSLPTYAAARAHYAAALERDLRAAGFPSARLVPIPKIVEPFNPGAAFKPGSARPLSHACVIPDTRMPEAQRAGELWVRGAQPEFALAGDLPEMVQVGAREVAAVSHATTLKRRAIVTLADTVQVSLQTNDLLPVIRNERCLDALVAVDVLMVMGVIHGAEAIATARYLDVGGREAVLRDGRYRVRYDPAGNFYLQETKVRPQYWIMSGWRVDVKVDKDVVTPEQRTQALKNAAEGVGGEVVVRERVLSNTDIETLLEGLRAGGAQR